MRRGAIRWIAVAVVVSVAAYGLTRVNWVRLWDPRGEDLIFERMPPHVETSRQKPVQPHVHPRPEARPSPRPVTIASRFVAIDGEELDYFGDDGRRPAPKRIAAGSRHSIEVEIELVDERTPPDAADAPSPVNRHLVILHAAKPRGPFDQAVRPFHFTSTRRTTPGAPRRTEEEVERIAASRVPRSELTWGKEGVLYRLRFDYAAFPTDPGIWELRVLVGDAIDIGNPKGIKMSLAASGLSEIR